MVISRWLGFCLVTYLFFSFPQKIWAAVVINEIHPHEEWVELYNPDGDDLSSCTLFLHKDNETRNTQKIELTEGHEDETFLVIGDFPTSTGWLANTGGDTVELVCSDFGDKAAYGDNGSLSLPGSGKSLARVPDGSDNWSILEQPTKGASNGDQPAGLPSPSSQVGPSPSSESSSEAELTISRAKDENGNDLYQVKIYIDGQYIHKVDNEVLYFCNDCFCDREKQVSCGFGEHTISLEKTGYESWSETNTFSGGNSFEANPVLKAIEEGEDEETSSSSPSPQVLGAASTAKPSSKTSSKETADSDDMLFREATFTGEVLGATESGEEKPEEKPEAVDEKKNTDWLLPLGLSGGGLVLLSTAAFPFVKPKLTKLLTRFSKKDPTA